MIDRTPFFLFSVDHPRLDNTTARRVAREELRDMGIPGITEVVGKYLGNHEISWIVPWNAVTETLARNTVRRLCLRQNQECYIERSGDGVAHFIDPATEKSVRAGKFVPTTDPDNCDGWTLVHGTYYTLDGV